MEIVIGTNNKGKLREYQIMLADLDVTLLSLDDAGIGGMDVDETGDSFRANAELKAVAYAKASGKYALADDSGLCVDALKGAPGIYSARYGGPGLDDAGRRRKLLEDIKDVEDMKRTAHFECVIALAKPETLTCLFTVGVCQGVITRTESDGVEGFGYDPVFQPNGYDKTFGDLPHDVKNRISHRGEATRQIIPILQGIIREANI